MKFLKLLLRALIICTISLVTLTSCNEDITEETKIPTVKDDIDISGIVFDSVEVVYDGERKFIYAHNLPKDVNVIYLGNGVSDPGEHQVKAIINDLNGNTLTTLTATIKIVKNVIEPTVPNENTPNDDPNVLIAQQIQAEYDALVAGTTTTHTTWTITGAVLDMSATQYNNSYGNYNVKLIIEVGGIYFGVYNGFVNGSYPTNINGLQPGTMVTITGTIKEQYTLTSGDYEAKIEFSNPEISWEEQGNTTPTPTVPNQNTNNVYFAMINDTHGAFVDSNDGTSIARVDTLLDGLEDKNGDYIKIANGDILQGAYVSSKTFGYQLIESLNLMDFDAFVIGNHEFDWGIDKIAAYKDGDLSNGEADFPFLGANIVYKSTGLMPDWIDPYTIVEYGDLKVGIIGIMGNHESSILATNVQDYDFVDDHATIVEKYAKELRTSKGCDVVVVATHDYEESSNNSIAKLSGDAVIDAIFCAHTHQLITESVTRSDGKAIPVLQNYDKNDTVQELILSLDETNQLESYSSMVYYSRNYNESSDFDVLYEKYHDLIVESEMVIGYTSSSINKSKVGDLAAKSMYYFDYNISGYETIDVTILNTGGVRATIDIGDITMADVFNTFPFENEIYLVKLYGKEVNSLLSDGYFYTYKSKNTFNSTTVYTVAVIDYVYFGSYYQSNFNKKISESETNLLMRDVFIEYLKTIY